MVFRSIVNLSDVDFWFYAVIILQISIIYYLLKYNKLFIILLCARFLVTAYNDTGCI